MTHSAHPLSKRRRFPLPTAARLLAAALLTGTALSAQADSKADIPSVELSASVSRQIPNDEMRVQLATEHSGQAIDQLNAAVLKDVQAALALARQHPGVKARAGGISTGSEWNKDGERSGWQVRGTLILEGTDTAAVAKLAGELAKQLQLENVSYRLSEPRRQEEENKLIAATANAFKTRARVTAEAFGRPDFRIKSLKLSTSQHTDGEQSPYPMMMKAAAESSAASSALPTDGGNTIITLTAQGTIELR